MNFNEYQEMAQRTSNTNNHFDKIENGVMGLNGEAGECIDIVKKWSYQGHPLDEEQMIEELGDVLWYIAETAEGIGYSMEEIAVNNIEKLKKRYPEGFSEEKSMNRSV